MTCITVCFSKIDSAVFAFQSNDDKEGFCYLVFQNYFMFQPYTIRTHLYFRFSLDHHVCHCGSTTLTTAHLLRCVSVTTTAHVVVFQSHSQCTTSTSYYDCFTHVNGNTNKAVYPVSIEIYNIDGVFEAIRNVHGDTGRSRSYFKCPSIV